MPGDDVPGAPAVRAAAPTKTHRSIGGLVAAASLLGAVVWLSWIFRFVPVRTADVTDSKTVALWVWDRWQHRLCLDVYQTNEGLKRVRRICATD